jgi:ComF family protein
MSNALKNLGYSLSQLFFPQLCAGCGSDILDKEQIICLHCNEQLPVTNFHLHANNPVEKIFWGRLPIAAAASLLYFTKNSILQQLLHQLKYKGNKEIGYFLGRQMGNAFYQSNRFCHADALIALPLFPSKERKRGYNQAAVLCEGFSDATGIPFLPKAVARRVYTDTQTHKNRIERWQNMEGKFVLEDEAALRNKRIILIDDVITTGATLEACGHEILKAPGVQLNIAALAYTSS